MYMYVCSSVVGLESLFWRTRTWTRTWTRTRTLGTRLKTARVQLSSPPRSEFILVLSLTDDDFSHTASAYSNTINFALETETSQYDYELSVNVSLHLQSSLILLLGTQLTRLLLLANKS